MTRDAPRLVTFYLHPGLLRRVLDGKHNFFNVMSGVLHGAGFDLTYREDGMEEMVAALTRPGYSVVLMAAPVTALGVTVRLNYLYPFWHIERSAKRWEWPVALGTFVPEEVDAEAALRFARFRRRQIFGHPATRPPDGRGPVYVPLQGRLLVRRSFQECTPLGMIRRALDHLPGRQLVITLHPKETYAPEELQALRDLLAEAPRCTLSRAPMQDILPACDMVVTQNSAVALSGFFLHKPAVLFGKSNFHHIAADVGRLGVAAAFARAVSAPPVDYDRYLWWFFHGMSVNAAEPGAGAQVTDRLRRAGWPL